MYRALTATRPEILQANIGGFEMVVILIIVVILFGANKLPQLGDSLGKSIKNFKRGLAAQDEIDVTPAKKELEGDKPAAATAESKKS
jgi:sec-independent protein translocase protein TatA